MQKAMPSLPILVCSTVGLLMADSSSISMLIQGSTIQSET
jgi:hypothetical protein